MASGLDQRQLGKSVQELAVVNGNEPPPRYIIRDGDHKENIDGNASFSPSIPTVNLQLLSSPSTPGNEKEAEMEKLGSALLCWGFFQAVGHGIPSSLLDEIRNVAKGFFDLPMEEKLKYSKIDGGVGSYGTDETVSEDQVLNWSDRLQFLVQPENQRNLCFWPDNPVRFREIMHEYSMKTSLAVEAILKGMERLIGLEDNYFVNQVGGKDRTFAGSTTTLLVRGPNMFMGSNPILMQA